MTSLIDVIFLLLLFFMLTSTFSKFAEVDLSAAGAGASGDAKPLFLQLGKDRLMLNGGALALTDLGSSPLSQAEAGTVLIVSLRGNVSAQRLTDLLVALRGLPNLTVTVLGD